MILKPGGCNAVVKGTPRSSIPFRVVPVNIRTPPPPMEEKIRMYAKKSLKIQGHSDAEGLEVAKPQSFINSNLFCNAFCVVLLMIFQVQYL